MNLVTSLRVFVAMMLGAAPMSALAYVKNEITQVDAAAGSLTINTGQGFSTYHTTPATDITLNGEKADLTSLAPGMTAVISGASGFASRVVATTGATNAKAAAGGAGLVLKDAKYQVLATASRVKPVIVGSVKAGQTVTIVPTKVHWSGGGSKKGVYCDWNGYPGKTPEGHSWMALIASVGEATFAPKNNALTFTVPADGVLALYPNDEKPQDNLGSGDFTVTVTPK